jgi:CheY-like chemotaxis protein
MLLAILTVMAIGFVFEKGILKPLRRRSIDTVMLSMIGLSMFMQNIAMLIWSPVPESINSPLTMTTITLGGLYFLPQRILVICFAILLVLLTHLLLNAADTMPGGGAITLDISETTESGRHFVVLRIRDTGRGMDKELLGRVLHPFFTARKTLASAHGLGLSVAQTAIHGWGGRIDIRSHPGHGTRLRLLLPRADVTPAKEPKAKPPEEAGGETILFVDDDAELVATMKTALREAGYRVLDATSGDNSIAIYTKQADQINLCIVDVVMPETDGKRVLEEILRIDPTAAIIMSSGFSREYVRGYLDRGAWAFIQKPYDRTQLLTVIRRVLDQKTARQKATAEP